jgi:dihydrofolate synthase/folylpolyglutamate synthase
MTYPEAIKYLQSFINYEKIPQWPYKESLKLERIKGFLKTIGDPQVSLKCLHIAGTKGKGSTCAFLTYILREAGYRVGLYTSPHLSDFRERIRILNPKSEIRNPKQIPMSESQIPKLADFEGMIAKDELADLVRRLKPVIEEYNKNSKYEPLSFFEVYTALAFVYFKEKKVDFAVLETGLGGRLDATNVVEPLVCAITSLSYEHTQKLGNTLREIATEKAGIIKDHQITRSPGHQLIVITAPQEKEAIKVIRNKCKDVGARLYEVNRDIFYEKTATGFNIMGMFGEYPNLEIGLLGKHQFVNASVAIGIVEALRFYGIIVGVNSLREGLYNTIWPGRCEVILRNPLVVLDGAQNVASAAALKEAVGDNFKYKRLILVLGISSDKDIQGICNQLYDLADAVILTKTNNPRATKPEVLAGYFKGKEIYLTNNVKEAIDLAKQKADSKDLILVTGSLFVVGEVRELFLAGPLPIFGAATR